MVEEKKNEEENEEEQETPEVAEESKSEEQTEEQEQTEELTDDPFADWSDIFPELKENREKALTEADVRKIVREEIKKWIKGVKEGKYPFPVKYPYPGKYPYPKKSEDETEEKSSITQELSAMKESQEKLQGTIEELQKSLDAIKKEVDDIRDTPIETFAKSLKEEQEKKEYHSPFVETDDGSITIRL